MPDNSYFIFFNTFSSVTGKFLNVLLEQKLKGNFVVVRFDWHGILKLQHPKDFDKLLCFKILGFIKHWSSIFSPGSLQFLGTCEQFKLKKLKMPSQLMTLYLS